MREHMASKEEGGCGNGMFFRTKQVEGSICDSTALSNAVWQAKLQVWQVLTAMWVRCLPNGTFIRKLPDFSLPVIAATAVLRFVTLMFKGRRNGQIGWSERRW